MQKYVYVIKYEQNLEFDQLPGVKMNSLQRISKKIKKTFHHVCHQIGYDSQTVLDYAKSLSPRQLLSLLFVFGLSIGAYNVGLNCTHAPTFPYP